MRITILRSLFAIAALTVISTPAPADDSTERLIAAMLGNTPVIDDLRDLTDTIGGRVTGTEANRNAVAWAAAVFRQAEVSVATEDFEMPYQWQERVVYASVAGDFDFDVGVVAKPFSSATDALNAPLLDAGSGSGEDFARLGNTADGAWVLVESPVLDDAIGLAGLFAEYSDAAAIEPRAFSANVAGVVFMSSRPTVHRNECYR